MSVSRIRGPKQFNPNVLFGRTASGRGEGHEIPFREFAAKIKPLLGISSTPSSSSSSGGGGAGGTGDVVGPSSAIDGDIAQFDGTTGKLLKDGGLSSASFDAAGAAAAALVTAEAYADTGDNAVKALRASSSVFGLCKVDNSSITASGGVLTATGFAPGGTPFHPGYQSGRWYVSPFVGAFGSGSFAINTLFPVPFYLSEAATFTKMGVSISGGAASKHADLLIYANNNGIPGALEYDAGTISIASTGIVTLTGLTLPLAAGWHWLAYWADGAAILSSWANSTSSSNFIGLPTLSATNGSLTGSATYSAGVPPNPFPSVTYGTGGMPLIGLGV